MKYVKVVSSQIAEVGYEPDTPTPGSGILGIKFPANKRQPNGSEYHYGNVSPRTHQALMAAESIGSYFGKNIKPFPDQYPFMKVEADPPKLSAGAASNTQAVQEPTSGFTEPDTPGTALALIDGMADDKLFSPGSIADAQLETMRSDWLAEAKKHDISTEAKRTELKRFARPLQKLRTGIKARAKELTGATKRKIAAIDAEKRRLVQVVGSIEDEVLSPLTVWEAEEEARKVRLANVIKNIEAKAEVYTYLDIPSIEAAIAELEAFDLSTMQEYKLSAESAVTAVLKRLKPELERRKVSEAERVELERLRGESAARAEADRQAEAKRREDERIAAAVEAAKVATRQEVIAEIARAETVEEPDGPGEDEPFEPQPTAYEPEKVPTPLFTRPVETHEQMFNRESVEDFMDHCGYTRQQAIHVLTAIDRRVIRHISITY